MKLIIEFFSCWKLCYNFGGDSMSEQETIQLIPSKVKIILKYIEQVFINRERENQKLIFDHTKIENCDTCVLKILHNNEGEYFNMGISYQYDTLLYSQLLISLLDYYLDSSTLKLSIICKKGDVDFTYSFYLFIPNCGNINVEISSDHNLDKIVNYYNERIFMKRNQIQNVSRGEIR